MSFLSQPLQDILIKSGRKIGDIALQVVINENTNDTLTITKQPVQQGASITDHAYKEPTTLTMSAYFQNNKILGFANPFSSTNPLSELYQNLLDLQSSRVPFAVITPKRTYPQMLMASLSQTTDKNTEYTLAVTMTFQEIIIVSVSTTQVPRDKQKIPAVTGATEKAGKKNASAAFTFVDGVRQALSRGGR